MVMMVMKRAWSAEYATTHSQSPTLSSLKCVYWRALCLYGTVIDVPLSAIQFIHKTRYSVSDILEENAVLQPVGVVDLSGIGYLVFQHIVQAAGGGAVELV